jgi:co-chaperonin GroES (HSP10)
MRLIYDRVAIVEDDYNKERRNLILLNHDHKQARTGTVAFCGSKFEGKVGDRVIWPRDIGTEREVDGKKYIFMNGYEVLAIQPKGEK